MKRDHYRCVVCGNPESVVVHHLLERRLFPDGGYYLENGASVCEQHHIECEQTLISVERMRELCGITKACLPEHLYRDNQYDKWSNIILPNGQRLKGELFYDESVQKILEPCLHLFTHYVKYPRTHHLPWSEGLTDDDRVLKDLSAFHGQRVIVTTKMDGENSSWYSDHYHARSIDSGNHPSRNLVKAMWAQRAHDIPEGWRICGENLYAQHSIKYTDLESYFYGFSVWNDRNECLSWDETLEWFQLLDIVPVPVLYDGIWDEQKIRALWNDSNWERQEGYVVRVASAFPYRDFRTKVSKMVRKGHVMTSKHHWMSQIITPNGLRQR